MSKTLVVSAVNFSEGGPFSILLNCLDNLLAHPVASNFEIIVLVHKKKLFDLDKYSRFQFIEFPQAKRNYINRLILEYYHFKSLSKRIKADYWLSLHDMSPRLPENVIQFVYCHNPSPFKKLRLQDLREEPSLFLFTLFYKYIYKFNIHANKYVIVQQNWIKYRFMDLFKLNEHQVVVAHPNLNFTIRANSDHNRSQKVTFFYPTLARPFKNIEVIGKAIKYLSDKNMCSNIEVLITIDGTENNYSKKIKSQFGNMPAIKFIGRIQRNEVYDLYGKSSALIFPSILETWGLPLSEFKEFNKPIFAANLPYAKETIGKYDKVKFFNSHDHQELAHLILKLAENESINFDETTSPEKLEPFAANWNELISLLLL